MSPFQVRPAEPVSRLQREVRQGRHLAHGLFHRSQRAEVSGADAQELPPFVTPQSFVELFRGFPADEIAEIRGVPRERLRLGMDGLEEGVRPRVSVTDQDVAQVGAAAEELEQNPHVPGREIGQRLAAPGFHEAAELHQRIVGRRRRLRQTFQPASLGG